MMQRLRTLVFYFLKSTVGSLAGIIYIILTLGFWILFFNPQQQTPETAYYKLLISGFGAGIAFLVTLNIASRANQAENYPLLVRLPNRLEYLTAVFLSALIFSLALQMLLALLALINGPALLPADLLEIPPLWLAPPLLAVSLALHATDLVTNGWSRIYIYGLLAIFLFGQSITNQTLTNSANALFRFSSQQGWIELSSSISQFSANVANSEFEVARIFSFLFWPFRAAADAAINGALSVTQALAPAIILFYAAILYMLAADFFANKDLAFTE